MKKIKIGIAFSICLFSITSFAAPMKTTKNNKVSIPCYNGGLSFGLAGYQNPASVGSGTNQISRTTVNSSRVVLSI